MGNTVVPSLPWSPLDVIKFSVLALEIFLKTVTWEKRGPSPSSQAIFSVQALLCWSFHFHKPLVGGLLPLSHLVQRRRVVADDLHVFNNCKHFVMCSLLFTVLFRCFSSWSYTLFLLTELLAFAHRRSECLWWEITVKQSQHPALKCPLPYKVGRYFWIQVNSSSLDTVQVKPGSSSE